MSSATPVQATTTTTVWPPPLLPSTMRNVAAVEADAPLNLGADEDEQVWGGESVGLGWGLLSKGKAGLDAVDWDCQLCGTTATDPCVTRCGHLFCWTHLREHLAAASSCPTCETPANMDRDVVQVFGRPKVLSPDTPWSSGPGSGASTCSFGPPTDAYPSVDDFTVELERNEPHAARGGSRRGGRFDSREKDQAPYLVKDQMIYVPVLAGPHSHESASLYGHGHGRGRRRSPDSLRLAIHHDLSHDLSSTSDEDDPRGAAGDALGSRSVPAPPSSSPVVERRRRRTLDQAGFISSDDNRRGLSDFTDDLPDENGRRPSTASWISGSLAGSAVLSQSGSSLWEGDSTYGTRFEGREEETAPSHAEQREDLPSASTSSQPEYRRFSFRARPMKGFWSTREPTTWLPPASQASTIAQEQQGFGSGYAASSAAAASHSRVRRSPSPDLVSPQPPPMRVTELRTRAFRPGQRLRFSSASHEKPLGDGSDSDDHLTRFRPSKPWYSPSSTSDALPRPARTPSRKMFRNMDVDYADEPQQTAKQRRTNTKMETDSAQQTSVLHREEEDQSPLGRAIMLLALALFLMVLLK